MTVPGRAQVAPHREVRLIGFYIFAFAAGGVIQPFLNLYLAEIGLSGAQIGIMQGWTALAAVALTPFVGVLADRTQRHRLILGVIVFVKGLSAALIPFSTAWPWLLGTVGLRVITAQAQDAIMNQLTLARLKAHNRTNLGMIRFWGALSFAATSLLAGLLARDRSVGVLFPLAGIMGAGAVLFLGGFPARIAPPSDDGTPARQRRGRRLWPLFIVILVFELGRSGPETFTYVHLVSGLGAGKDLVGALSGLSGLVPLAAFALTDRLLARRGALTGLALSIGLYSLGCAGLAVLPASLNPRLALFPIAAQAFGQSLHLISIVILLGALGSSAHAATNQALAQLAIPGLARLAAQPISGWLFDAAGGSVLFAADALIGLVAVGLLMLWGRERIVSP